MVLKVILNKTFQSLTTEFGKKTTVNLIMAHFALKVQSHLIFIYTPNWFSPTSFSVLLWSFGLNCSLLKMDHPGVVIVTSDLNGPSNRYGPFS